MLEDTGSGLVISSRQSRVQLPDDYGNEVIVLDANGKPSKTTLR
jgi:hypothetical protein